MTLQNGNGGRSSFYEAYEAAAPAAEPTVAPLPPAPWPAPIRREAYHGLAGRFVDMVEPETEADPVAILAQFLTFFGNAAGRHAYCEVEACRHYPALYCVLVGPTAKGRKGTSLGRVKAPFRLADPDWFADHIASGLSSGEGLIYAVRDSVVKCKAGGEEEVLDEGVRDKRLLVIEEEFAQVLQLGGREGNTLSTMIRSAWDNGILGALTRKSPLKATDTHVSIVSHVTRDDLLKYLNATDQANGFANRFLWLAVKRSKLLPFGGQPLDLQPLADWLQNSLARARMRGRVKRSAAASELWESAYPRLTGERHGAFGACTSRAEAQCLRLSLVYALLDGRDEIGEEHLLAALAVWDYCERSCRWVFGEVTGHADADEILEALRCAPGGLTGREIHGLFNRHRSAVRVRKALGILEEAGLARYEKQQPAGGGAGRPVERWFYSQNCELREQIRPAGREG